MTDHRKGEWLQTRLGRRFWPQDPRPGDFDILDIAAALSKICRYGGHCTRFYSVAEHSVLAARSAPPALALCALMHDASEAYLVDIPHAVKVALPDYAALEDRVMRAIATQYGFAWPMPAEVKRIDTALLADERAAIMRPTNVPNHEWGATEPALGVVINAWSPDLARDAFMNEFQAAIRFNRST